MFSFLLRIIPELLLIYTIVLIIVLGYLEVFHFSVDFIVELYNGNKLSVFHNYIYYVDGGGPNGQGDVRVSDQ